MQNSRIKGRGVHVNSPNRFEQLSIDPASYAEFYEEGSDEEDNSVKTEYYRDYSKSVLTKNESPDLGA